MFEVLISGGINLVVDNCIGDIVVVLFDYYCVCMMLVLVGLLQSVFVGSDVIS